MSKGKVINVCLRCKQCKTSVSIQTHGVPFYINSIRRDSFKKTHCWLRQSASQCSCGTASKEVGGTFSR
ncbi:hypothetical protein HZS_7844 [Henneguya salminicola]|nr:hypothetical protein HZS_7844 [Henneguya salminicola]